MNPDLNIVKQKYMPEGPSIVILKEEANQFAGHKIISVEGNSKIEKERLLSRVTGFKSWGKHFLICFEGFFVRIHFLMWGSYRINERKERDSRLTLVFENGELNFYSCAVKIIEGDPVSVYDFSSDVMGEQWNPAGARKKLKSAGEELVGDVLLDQEIFSGVGNIIKNEVLYRIRIQPESVVGKIPPRKITSLINEAWQYSFEFYDWKKKYELKKHWLAHNKKICLRCNLPFVRKHTGKRDRRSFFCTNCQSLYI